MKIKKWKKGNTDDFLLDCDFYLAVNKIHYNNVYIFYTKKVGDDNFKYISIKKDYINVL